MKTVAKTPAKTVAKVAVKADKKTVPAKNTISITLIKSLHHRLPTHRATVTGLGLKRINHTVKLIDTPEIRGMINKISYLLRVEK
ncbi:MAG: 50S ribosomal protein L30 [Candidatus Thioglobus sp.]|nr:50S ribosomal protein L30 [Candidatus Thioglobus sp.]